MEYGQQGKPTCNLGTDRTYSCRKYSFSIITDSREEVCRTCNLHRILVYSTNIINNIFLVWSFYLGTYDLGMYWKGLKGGMKYLMRSVKYAAEAVGIWTEENRDVKRVNWLYTMVSGRFNFKINKRFDSLSWSSVVRYLYTRRGYIIGELNEEQEQAWQDRKKKR